MSCRAESRQISRFSTSLEVTQKLITMKILAFVLFCFQFSFANAIQKGDSLKSRFDINDPRNPQCPCHKYQKLADEEYRKFLGKEIKLDHDNNENSFKELLAGGIELNSNNKTSTKKFRSAKWRNSFFNFKKKKSSKRKKVRRLRRDNASCYHF